MSINLYGGAPENGSALSVAATVTNGGAVTRAQIIRLQQAMMRAGAKYGDTDQMAPVTHHFAPGLYAREMFIPAGACIIGKTHRHAHLNSVSRGRIMVASEHGTREVAAGETFISQPGIKRVGVALEDTIWITFHPTDKIDLAEIEADVIIAECEALECSQQLEAIA